ncbi:MAG: hypothetical protein ACRYGO_23250 [Janthinobacterium lividum]
MNTIRKTGNTLQIYSNLQEFDLAVVDAFDYDRHKKVVTVFSNGIPAGSIVAIDTDQWNTLKNNFGNQFLKYSWASFKQNCITNPASQNQEIQVNFSKNTYARS